MTDAPRPDLTAADWTAMRQRCSAMGTGWRLRRDTDSDGHETGYGTVWMPASPPVEADVEWHLTDTCIPIEQAEFIFYAITDLPLALDALARQQEEIEQWKRRAQATDPVIAQTLADRDATIARLRAWLDGQMEAASNVIQTTNGRHEPINQHAFYAATGMHAAYRAAIYQLDRQAALPPAKEADREGV